MGVRAFRQDGKGISEYMSPVQALHLSLTLIDQKFWDPKYQVDPAEWETQLAQGKIPRALPDPQAGSTYSVRAHNFPRARELDRRLNATLSSLSTYEGLKMVLDMVRN